MSEGRLSRSLKMKEDANIDYQHAKKMLEIAQKNFKSAKIEKEVTEELFVLWNKRAPEP